MKIIFLTLIMASVSAYPVVKTWTFHELSHAIEKENPFAANADPEKKPLIDAFDLIMAALFTGKEDHVHALIMSPTGSKIWTIDQLKKALNDTHTNPDLMPFVAQAYQWLMNQNSKENGQKKETTEVWVPALDISTWTLHDVLKALEDPKTKRGLIPYLKEAQKQFEDAKDKGLKKENVTLVTPVGLIPLADGVVPTIVQRRTIDEHHNNLIKGGYLNSRFIN